MWCFKPLQHAQCGDPETTMHFHANFVTVEALKPPVTSTDCGQLTLTGPMANKRHDPDSVHV